MSNNTGNPTLSDDNDPQLMAMDVALGLILEDKLPELITKNPEFQTALADWRVRLAPLDDTAMPVEPTSALWPRLSASLALSQAQTSAQGASSLGAAHAQPVTTIIRAAKSNFLATLWENLSFWRGVGLAGAVASALLATGLVVMTERAQRKPIFVAILMTERNETAAVVNAFADGTAELVPTRHFAVPAGKAIEIWTLWDRQIGPRSIGLIEKARTIRLDLRHLPKTKSGQLFEMTLEPSTGSPTGRPTGPILTKGTTEVAL